MKHFAVLIAVALIAVIAPSARAEAQRTDEASRPNIILILADDK